MARSKKQVSSSTQEAASPVPEEKDTVDLKESKENKKRKPKVQQPESKPEVKETKTRPRKGKETVPPPSEETSDSAPAKSTRRPPPTRELVEKEFDDVIARVDEEIARLRQPDSKSKGVKFLRSINKSLKSLRTRALRITKPRSGMRRNNTSSGFLKPVPITEALANFTGWDQDQPHSRVDVTKFICNYIKENDLQNPEDRRQILIEKDPKLKSLLSFDGKDKKPLTYYSLQTYLKHHFKRSSSEEPAVPEKVEKKSRKTKA